MLLLFKYLLWNLRNAALGNKEAIEPLILCISPLKLRGDLFSVLSPAVQPGPVSFGSRRADSRLDEHLGQLALAMQSPPTIGAVVVVLQLSRPLVSPHAFDSFSRIPRTSKKRSQRRRPNSSTERDRR